MEIEVKKVCKEIFDSIIIKLGMCLHITAILVKYLQSKKIIHKLTIYRCF